MVERLEEDMRRYGAPIPQAPSRKDRVKNFDRLRRRWKELFAEARRKGQIPKAGRRRFIRSKTNIGEQHAVIVNRFIDDQSIEEILYRVANSASKISGKYKTWLITLVMTTLGDPINGYAQRILITKDPDAPSFQTQLVDSTGLQSSFHTAMVKLEDLLEDYAREEYALVFLNYARIMNYDRR
jgi:hypothetical protein